MIESIVALQAYFKRRTSSAYTRDHYDRFLKDHPFHFTIPAIHITGTNGKGSTATFLSTIYQTRFKKVGLFTSPSLDAFQEMITINQVMISDSYILDFFNQWSPLFDDYGLTTFEMQTLLAFHYFQDQQCDFAIIEVGMGGKIDATNIFNPVLSIITNFSLEHQSYLGPTIADIANHKGGIIKQGVPVLIGPLPPTGLEVIEAIAHRLQAPLYHRSSILEPHTTHPIHFHYRDLGKFSLSMHAAYQIDNAALAIEATIILEKQFPIAIEQLKAAVFNTFMPGRLEIIQQQPMILLDGAHNPGGIEALVQSLSHHKHPIIYVLFASFKDKEVSPMLASLKKMTPTIMLTTFPHPRARGKADYQEPNLPFIEDYQQALRVLQERLPPHGVLLITGSLAFIGLIRSQWIRAK